jgi:hypothetical protein
VDLYKSINVYCERTEPSYWSEPLNASSNIAFILVGLIWLQRVLASKNNWSKFFAINSVVIGFGSYFFHTYANVWSLFTDIVPIMLFIGSFFYYTFKKIFLLNGSLSISMTFIFISIVFFIFKLRITIFNGSEVYLPVLIALVTFGMTLLYKRAEISSLFLKASTVFTLSLALRSIDNVICTSIPIGSHFLWHLLNSYLIYVLIEISFKVSNTPKQG